MDWIVKPKLPKKAKELHPELPDVVLQLLWNRDITTPDAIDEFLNPDWEEDIHDPFLFNDMAKAVERVDRSIECGERIAIHGDYDADGVAGSVILFDTLQALGASLDIYLPHRETEGYGLGNKAVDYLADKETKLIVTCDCGISNLEAIAYAKDKGIDVIVTDHHTIPPKLPDAYAILHPQREGERYPWRWLAGGGVAFKFAQALLRTSQFQSKVSKPETFEKWLLDMVAISTVADMVPLLGENRTLVRYGLVVLTKTRRLGLLELYEIMNLHSDATTETISFQLAPRINAAGRLDHANAAVALLLEHDRAQAHKLALNLDQTNRDRQAMTEIIASEAIQQVASQENEPILIARRDDWPLGMVGLVAGRIMDRYQKPVLLFTKHMGLVSASGRSTKLFNLIQALQALESHLQKFGGHPQACGLSLKATTDFDAFIKKLRSRARTVLKKVSAVPSRDVDAEITLHGVTWELVEILQKFEPFGVGNPEPTYLIAHVELRDMQPVGSDGRHVRLTVSDGDEEKKVIAFGFAEMFATMKPQSLIDILVTISVNEWNGNRELQLQLVDFRHSAV